MVLLMMAIKCGLFFCPGRLSIGQAPKAIACVLQWLLK